MRATAGKVTGFTGVLVSCTQKPGNKYAQLVFHTPEGVRLAASRDLRMALSLNVGQTFKVKGREMEVAGETIIHNPTAKLVLGGNFFKRHIKMVLALLVLVPAVAYAGIAYAHGQLNLPQRMINSTSVETEGSADAPTLKVSAKTATPAAPAEKPAAAPASDETAPAPTMTVKAHKKSSSSVATVTSDDQEDTSADAPETASLQTPVADPVAETPPQTDVTADPPADQPAADAPVPAPDPAVTAQPPVVDPVEPSDPAVADQSPVDAGI